MSAESTSLRPFAWMWLAYTAIVIALALGVWIPTGLYKKMDFRAMYAAGTLARTDPSHLYDLARQKQLEDSLVEKHDVAIPFGHLAYDAILFVPFSLLSYRTAYLLVVLVNTILIIACFLAARKEFSTIIQPWQPRPGLIFFLFMPTLITVAQGQDSLLLLLILCVTWRLLDGAHHFAAGFVLANMLLKPHLALLIALFLLVRYGWRFIAGFATGSAAVMAICLPFWRHGGWRAWLSILSDLSLASGHSREQEAAMGIYSWAMPNLRGALLLILGHVLSSRALFAVVGLISLAVLVWALAIAGRLSARNAFAFSTIVTVLVSYNFEAHDLVLLLLPMVLMEADVSKTLARCRDVILILPIALLLFAPSNPPGAGFTLMCAPLLLIAVLLSRVAQSQVRVETMVSAQREGVTPLRERI
jgi:hypothetical protein